MHHLIMGAYDMLNTTRTALAIAVLCLLPSGFALGSLIHADASAADSEDCLGCGFIGIHELNIVLGNWNMNVPPADPAADWSGDGYVGIDDLNAVLSQWNAGTPPGELFSCFNDLGHDMCGGDGFIGIEDVNLILGYWNQTVPPADPMADHSGDGYIGIDDLGVILANWNAGTPPALPGELCPDGVGFCGGTIGINDLNIVLGNWNQTSPPADPSADHSNDGYIGIDDLNWVLIQWNPFGTPPVANAVPEPAMLVLLGLGASAVFGRRGYLSG